MKESPTDISLNVLEPLYQLRMAYLSYERKINSCLVHTSLAHFLMYQLQSITDNDL